MKFVLPAFSVLLLAPALLSADDTTELTFEKHIAPVLAARCGQCHSNDVQKGDLNLASMAGLLRGGESGEPSVAETADDSLLWSMIDGGGMPPEDEPQLTDAELTVIRQWLESGAKSDAAPVQEEPKLSQHDVIPILLLRCVACHGASIQQGGVDLRSAESILAGGDNGPIVNPGEPQNSLLLQRIETEACPPRGQLLKFFVRRPGSSERQTLSDWIEAGAPVTDEGPDVAGPHGDTLVTERDREHWAFQPPRKTTDHQTLDGFVEARLQSAGLEFSPQADRNTLIRRAWLDLLGMPPSPQEWATWRDHPDDDWFAQMVDQLLQSPHYGERWGRFWLDVAGYADSEGGVTSDPVRQAAWKYRDYVIRSFNEDKPWDRFLLEQIAGDELIDHQNAAEITPQMVDNLVATGFLRMGIDQTGSRTMNFVPERLGVIGDAISVLGSGVMGLTLECARCHSHKYDPIPQRDYYRFKAIFQGAMDEHDWLSFRQRSLTLDTPARREQVAAVNPPLQKQQKQLQQKLAKTIRHQRMTLLSHHHPQLTDDERKTALRALKIADNVRTLTQRKLVEKLQKAELLPDDLQPDAVLQARQTARDIRRQIVEVQRQMEPNLTIRALWDRGRPSPTYILRRGDHDKPGRLVGPGVPAVLTDGQTSFDVQPPFPDGTPKTGRRLAFAHWLTRPEHPLTARVLVNRVWYHHFGQGIVTSLENFGRNGARPTHPELLDWLAVEFVHQGWSVKQLHRTILNSRTWQQSSAVTDTAAEHDSQNRLLSRMALRRMDAEALRDSLLAVAGRLDRRSGGIPDAVEVDRDGLVSVLPTSKTGWRRSVYLQYRRTEIPSMLATFDYPEMGPNCVNRSVSTVSPQSLMLMNGALVRELAESLAEQVHQHSRKDATTEELIHSLYEITLTRSPSSEEEQAATAALHQLRQAWQDQPDQALVSLCHTMLNSAAFLYID